MKNLIAELLLKLAAKEEEAKELTAQVEALEIVVTAMLRKMEESQRLELNAGIEVAMRKAADDAATAPEDASLLQGYIQRLLTYPRY
ncbi:anti-adapter protein IraP [Erwiniaceae bacterium BAC15a-03b]|uniref:Anti-adapter protein IraP n=1 Tax=Winslowiella arboricola TaxID=2978220 RepID=A0A9J6PD55_9GAMM|nr:anti-adapter protein IraP [Winslowiella arboricola]MCU5772081.1 anti-adapter protein IraP [Winslowiella arboricola]MCU5776153.1 anti-adapter protein IraP [Winslowiella arboricola]